MSVAIRPGSTELSTQDSGKPPGRVRRRRRRSDGPAAAAFLAPTLGGFAVFTAFPIVASVLVAFTVWPLAGSPTFAGVDNFVQLLTKDPAFIKTVINTLIFVVAYVPLNLALSLAIAAWISPRVKGANVYRVLLFIPVVTPMVANAAVWQIMLIPNGLIDSVWQQLFGVSAPNFLGSTQTAMLSVVIMSLWQGFGYNLLIFSSALQAVPESLLDSAAIDGAGPIRRYFSIKLPLMSPSIFFGATMTLITSFQVFAQPFILTNGGPSSSTTTMVMYLYRSGFQFFNLGYASAIGVLLFVMILIITGLVFLAQKRWVHYD
ncbi:sn-glycerol-3-phosphate transport system permease protein UgpA [Frondihabitans sp. 762G35]|uniref:carbohydrate ABC transporter permease n=1 Tax=Frondihabitans sp. 762G35 TaxID=1446794 RepID=UPI000D218404|nr:sugar ABC transporter permease [Frondihabitans sp. 762G35]ARC56281.1 sn-glycerol-3-phosphate transport system permease protein UgpA [Frondihabitans sp. 762G35]